MKKKSLYRFLVGASLLGAATTTAVYHPTLVYANSGTFTVGGSTVNVRRSPSTDGEVVAQYSPGQVIEYDSIVEGDGYRWISYVGGSGNRNYVAIGTADGSQSFGHLNGGASTTTSADTDSGSVESDFSSISGTWVNAQGEKLTISSDGRFTGNTLFGYKTDALITANEAIGNAYSRDKGYFQYNVENTGFIYDSTTDAIYVYTHSGAPWGSRVDFLYSRESTQTPQSSETQLSEKENPSGTEETEVKTVSPKPWTGDNPYPTNLITDFVQPTRDGSNPKAEKYALYDIDGNGTPELLLGSQDEVIWQVQTLINGQPEVIGASDGQSLVMVTTAGTVISSSKGGAGVDFNVVRLRADNSGTDKETISWTGQGDSPISSVTSVSDIEWKLVSDLGKESDKVEKPEEKAEEKSEDKPDNQETTEETDVKTVAAKPWTGDNPYKDFLKEATYFENTNDGKPVTLDYALYDIDGNGTPELLVGRKGEGWLQAVYTLVDNKLTKVTELGIVGGVAGAGGYRGGITIYENSSIVLSEWGSGTGEGTRQIFRLNVDNSALAESENQDFSMRKGDKPGLVGETQIDHSTLDWKSVSETDTSEKTEEETEQSKQDSSVSNQTETSSTVPSQSNQPKTLNVNKKPEGNPIQRVYKRVTGRQELPSTGEAVSKLGVIGLGLIGLGIYLYKRGRKD